MNVLVLHGPTLDWLGLRPGDAPGETLEAVDRRLAERARPLRLILATVRSNREGDLLDALRARHGWASGVLLSPGPGAMGAHALRAAVRACGVPVVEVHLTDVDGVREHSALRDVAAARVVGGGPAAYLEGLDRLASLLRRMPPGRREVGLGLLARGSRGLRAIERLVGPGAGSSPAVVPHDVRARGDATGSAARVSAPPPAQKTLGRKKRPVGSRVVSGSSGPLSRKTVRARIADRLSGRLGPGELAAWARTEWLALQGGGPAESGQRDILEDTLQTLLLAAAPGRLSDEALVALMAGL